MRYCTIPQPTGPGGVPQQQAPDLYGVVHQVNDYTISSVYNGSAPTNVRHNMDTGKVYRSLIFTVRDTGVAASAAQHKNNISALRGKYGDDVQIWAANGQELRTEQFVRNGRDLPTGVYLLDFCSDSGLFVGDDYRRDYVDTRDLAQFWVEIDYVNSSSGAVNLQVARDVFLVPAGVAI